MSTLIEEEQKQIEQGLTSTINDNDMQEQKDTAPMVNKYIYDRDQTIPKCAHSSTDQRLNKIDPKCKHNLTIGDVEAKECAESNNRDKTTTYWFAMAEFPNDYKRSSYDQIKGAEAFSFGFGDGKIVNTNDPKRKMFTSIYIHRIVNVDTASDTFRVIFSMTFRWIATYLEYKKYTKSNNEDDTCHDWESLKDYPNIEFKNVIEEHSKEWSKHSGSRAYAIRCDHLNDKKIVPPLKNDDKAQWIHCRLNCDITFRESYELQSYPFDCQDLTILANDKYYGVWIFLPELNNPNVRNSEFSYVDPQTSSIEEWELENVVLQIGDLGKNNLFVKPGIITNIKLARRWKPILLNTVFVMFLLSVLSLTTFTMPFEDTSSRLGVTLTLILTAVLFDTQTVPRAYLTFMDKYFLFTYFYLGLMTFIVSFCGAYYDNDGIDDYLFITFVILFIFYHIGFVVYGFRSRLKETKKINMTYNQVEEYNKKTQEQRPRVILDCNKRERFENGFVFSGIKSQ